MIKRFLSNEKSPMVSRRGFLQTTAAASLFSLLSGSLPAEPSASGRKLSVLFLMVDDLRPELNCYGVPEVVSPNIDRLAAKGMRFDRTYCQYPVCNPSRSSMLTGFRPETLGIFTNEKTDCFRLKRPDVVTLPQLFRQNGYQTASFGKIMHNGINTEGKWEFAQDPLSWAKCETNQKLEPKTLPKAEGEDYSDKFVGKEPNWCWWRSVIGDEVLPDSWTADQTIAALNQSHDGPFFIAAGFQKPHDPYVAPKRYFDLYPEATIKLPEEPADRSPLLSGSTENNLEFVNFTTEDRKALKRAYHAGTSYTDAQIGRVLDTMDQLKLWDNTIVVLLADHGYQLWEHDWWHKPSTFDLCARVPCIVWVPGFSGMGQNTRAIVESLDLYPTLTELCGLPAPSGLEGKSFADVLKNPSHPGKEAAYTLMRSNDGKDGQPPRIDARSVRTDSWRYTEWANGDVALFDHVKDPGEYYNLACKPEYKDTCAQLKEVLHRIQKA